MIRFFVLFLLIFISGNALTQHIYSDTTWERWYGRQYYNELPSATNQQIEHYDKGYIFHLQNDFPSAPLKPILKKTDINGYFLWERKLDSTLNKAINGIKKYDDGGIIVYGGIYHNNNEFPNPWVAKLNACMEVEWCKLFQWNRNSYVKDLAIDLEGNIVALTFGYGEYLNERINLIKLAPDGELIWKGNYATRDDYPHIWNAIPQKLLISQDNHYYIAGKAEWPTNNVPGQGSGVRSLFIKVNPDGEEEWLLPFGIYDNLFTQCRSLYQISDTMFAGLCHSYTSHNPVMVYFNENGEVLSFVDKTIMPEFSYENKLVNPILLEDNTFWGIWRYLYTSDEVTYHYGYMHFDTALNIIDYKEDDRWRDPANLKYTFNNKFVTFGSMKENNSTNNYDIYLNKRNFDFSYDTVYSNWSGDYDTLCPEGIVSGYLPYTCDMIVGIDEIPSPEEYKEAQEKIGIQVQPNPAHTQVTLILENTSKFKNLHISVFNQTGEEVYTRKLRNCTQEELLNISNWSSGIYFIVIRNESKMVGSTKLVVE